VFPHGCHLVPDSSSEAMDNDELRSPRRGPRHTPAPSAPGTPTTSVTCPGGTEHVRAVRAGLRAALRDCPRADDVILCASELAANACLHSRSRLPGGTFTVRATVSPDRCVWIEVHDDGGPWNQEMTDPARHHGLGIVAVLADEWGIDGDHTTRTIWARFGWDSRA
jgi:serine/threonine-protein kinase RsbW